MNSYQIQLQKFEVYKRVAAQNRQRSEIKYNYAECGIFYLLKFILS